MIREYDLEQQEGINRLVLTNTYEYHVRKMNSTKKIVNMMNDIFNLKFKAEEYVYVVALSITQEVIGVFLLSKGDLTCSIIRPREVFARVLLCASPKIVLVHNHPSGGTQPSEWDEITTRRLKCSCMTMGIQLMDHIIVGRNYYSFRENKKL